jgi:arylsulfatase A-like enzyme
MRALSLLGVCVLAKVCVLAGRDLPLSLWSPLAYLWQDLLLALLFAGLDSWTRRPRVAWALYAILVTYLAVNVPVARVLSTPLTWPLLHAAGAPLADSIWHYATWENAVLVLLVLVAALGFPLLAPALSSRLDVWNTAGLRALVKLSERLADATHLLVAGVADRWSRKACNPKSHDEGSSHRGRQGWRIAGRASLITRLLPAGAALAYLGPLATQHVETLGLHRNAVAALFTTAFPRLPARADAADWRASRFAMPSSSQLSGYRGAAAGRNVVLVSLESTAAGYLRPYGAAEDPMPRLTDLARQSILFENAYAVYPESIKGLYAVLCSSYPAIHTPPETYEHVPCDSLAEQLAHAGYRTALFHSGRFGYLGMESIVQRRGYHLLEDAGQIGGDHHSSFGVDEASTVKRILAWLDSLAAGERFFITYLPIAGHHPYATPKPGPFPEHDARGCYQNSLHYADAALGLLIDGLRQRRLDRDTMWVIFGDHGEAFGQHEGNFGHTLFIYEENIHVPFLIAAPSLTSKPIRVHDIASLLDVAPTVLDLLGLGLPASYEGESLLTAQPRMALFFTDYTLSLLGLRDDHWKFIHEIDSGRSKLFDLHGDPAERFDLSGQEPALVATYRSHLLRWCGYQREKITRVKFQSSKFKVQCSRGSET